MAAIIAAAQDKANVVPEFESKPVAPTEAKPEVNDQPEQAVNNQDENDEPQTEQPEGLTADDLAAIDQTIAEIFNTKPTLQIVDYSEKAFAIIGETKPVKEQLKQLGGRFNAFLKCGAGWIFPKSKLSAVKLQLSI